ncbi:anti-sigma factor [Arthrobacter sp. NPDC055585]
MNEQLYGDALHELAPLFAIDALEPDERAAFEQHLAGCARCQAEVADFSEVSAHLAVGAAQEPPPELRASVLGAIHGTRPRQVPRLGEDPGPPAKPANPPVPLHTRRRRRPLLLAAAAAALLLPAAGLAGWALGTQFEQQQEQEQAADSQQRQDRLLAAPDLSVQRLDVDGQPATLLFSEEQDSALFVAEELPDPGADREYQLWLLEDGTPIPDVHFAGGEVRVWLTGEVSRAGTVALTVEPSGGSTTPTFPLVAAAEI